MLQAYINGIPYPTLRDFSVSEQAGNKTSTRIKIDATGLDAPKAGDIVELKDGDEILFWGLSGIPTGPKFKTGLERHIYTVVCSNANSLLSNRIINVAYQGYTVTQIINSLFEQYISQEGITLGTVSDMDVTFEVYTAKDYNLQDALNELADLAGATWQISEDKVFSFVAVQDFPILSTPITASFLPGTELQHATKDYKLRTVQIVSGATDTTSPQTESYTYDGTQQAFTVIFPVAKKPTVYVNDVQVPTDRVGVNGINDGDENMVFLFSFNSQNINYIKTTNYLTEGAKVTFTYTGLFPIRVIATNDNKITELAERTGTSGRREFVQIASNLTAQSDALKLAQSLLQQFEAETSEVKFWVWTDMLPQYGLTLADLRVLTQITFDLPAYGVVGNYVITERTLKPAYADMSNPATDGKLQAAFVLRDRDYLKSYGETISDIRRDITALSVRADDIVINVQAITERLKLTEQYTFGPMYIWPLYPTPTTAPENGGLFIPGSLDIPAFPV